MDKTDPKNIIEWDFTPYKPIRPEITGEVVFFKKWVSLMLPQSVLYMHEPVTDDAPRPEGYLRTDRYFIENPEREGEFPVMNIWRDYGIPNAHDTRIMSNFVVWLGTNAGHAMLAGAQTIMQNGTDQRHAYLFAWHMANIRNRSINHGRIYRDSVATKFDQSAAPQPHPTAYDLETIEHVCLWLGTSHGQKHLQSCQHNLQIKYARQNTLSKHNNL